MLRFRRVLVVAAVALAVAAGGCGGDDDDNPVDPGNGGGNPPDVTIQIVGDLGTGSFSPNPDTVTVGQTVSWHNADVMAHTATSDGSGSGSFNTGTIGAGATSTPIAMNIAGSFPYHCSIHPGMTGTLVVQP